MVNWDQTSGVAASTWTSSLIATVITGSTFVLPPPIGIKTLPQIQYYQPGEGYFYPHIDAEALVKDRVLVYITYLNDCPDGGTIMVNNDGFTIHAQKGKTVIFPAGITHKHVGEISQTHEKYICTGWVEWLR